MTSVVAINHHGRFGFTAARAYRIANQEGQFVDYLLALELSQGGMRGMEGRFGEDDAFHIRDEELKEFEKGFPPREKPITSTQLKADM